MKTSTSDASLRYSAAPLDKICLSVASCLLKLAARHKHEGCEQMRRSTTARWTATYFDRDSVGRRAAKDETSAQDVADFSGKLA
jgi:hypothetical protein